MSIPVRPTTTSISLPVPYYNLCSTSEENVSSLCSKKHSVSFCSFRTLKVLYNLKHKAICENGCIAHRPTHIRFVFQKQYDLPQSTFQSDSGNLSGKRPSSCTTSKIQLNLRARLPEEKGVPREMEASVSLSVSL
jgi:hypothetical protein